MAVVAAVVVVLVVAVSWKDRWWWSITDKVVRVVGHYWVITAIGSTENEKLLKIIGSLLFAVISTRLSIDWY